MKRNTIAEMKEIIEAIEQGKSIQWFNVTKDKWDDTTNKRPNFTDSTYRIKPETEETLLTNRELAKWIAQGNGECCAADFDEVNRASIGWWYEKGYEDETAQNALIRKFDDTEWRKPTREYAFGEEEK